MSRNTLKVFLAIGDYIVMFASLSVILYLRYRHEGGDMRFNQHMGPFAIVFATWIVIFYILELYDINAPFNHRNFLYAMLSNVALSSMLFYTFDSIVDISPRRNLALVTAVFVVLFYLWRLAFSRLVDTIGWHRAVAIIGSDDHSIALARKIESERRQGFRVAVIVREPTTELPQWLYQSTIRIIDSVSELKQLVREQHIHTVVISDRWYYAVYNDLYDLIPFRLKFFQLSSFWERFDESIPIYATRETWFLENLNRGPSKGYHIIKRAAALITVLALLPLFLPLGLLTALVVRISSPGKALFSQTRIGRNDQPFTLYKFRSMYIDAEKHGAQWAQERDPRVTPVGRFIRATRLDEIPQIMNVLKGEMSFIGPRPERPEFVTTLSKNIPHYHLRHLVKPGLTGWAQVKYRYGASEEDAATKLTYDLYYVKNVSLVLDIKIILKTIMTILGGRGR